MDGQTGHIVTAPSTTENNFYLYPQHFMHIHVHAVRKYNTWMIFKFLDTNQVVHNDCLMQNYNLKHIRTEYMHYVCIYNNTIITPHVKWSQPTPPNIMVHKNRVLLKWYYVHPGGNINLVVEGHTHKTIKCYS